MCEIAPLSPKCIYEDGDAIMCKRHKIKCYFIEMCLDLPILNRFVEPYVCPNYYNEDLEKACKEFNEALGKMGIELIKSWQKINEQFKE